MKLLHLAVVIVCLASIACHPGPVVGKGTTPPSVGGTISGIVSTVTNTPVSGRRVIAIETVKGTRYDATTAANGGYTIKVPEGTYRLDVQLRPGEKIVTQPDETKIGKSDLDAQRNFVISGGTI
jgi:hypothetical protein